MEEEKKIKKKTLFKNKSSSEPAYLLDRVLKLDPNERIAEDVKANMLEEAVQTSYRKAAEECSAESLTKQTTKNLLHNLEFPDSGYDFIGPKKKVEVLYIEADYIKRIPDTTTILFVDKDVDKRTKMYKAVKDNGYPCEFKLQDNNYLRQFVAKKVTRAGKLIRESTCEYMVNTVGSDMNSLANETDKLISYAWDSEEITVNHINSICFQKLEGKVFEMVDSLVAHDKKRAMELYSDILALRENAFGIIALVRMNYNRLLQIADMIENGSGNADIASTMKIKEFFVKKYRNQLREYDTVKLTRAVEETVITEERIKSGNIGEQMGLEIMLANLLAI